MLHRDELWGAFLDAADVARTAIDAQQTAPSPANRRAVDDALRDCMNRLAPVIGTEAAFRFEAAIQQFREISHRVSIMQAMQAPLDLADSARLQLLEEERSTAQQAFLEVARATLGRINAVVERDLT